MDYDTEKVGEAVLALLYLNPHEMTESGARAWKGFDWDAMSHVHEKGIISDPVSKAKSVVLAPAGVAAAKQAFEKFFSRRDQ